MMYYRGYISTINKKSTMRFKGVSNLLSLDEAQRLDEYAGVLADGIVLVDFDDSDMARRALEIVRETSLGCRVYRTTRGIHILLKANPRFEGCGTGIRLACGMEADIKLGSRNSYEVLKIDGKEREIIWDSEPSEAPAWLYPCRTCEDLHGLGEGDGRNDALYRHILALSREGIGKEDSRRILGIINRHVFGEPLDDAELAKISRDESFDEIEDTARFFQGRTFLHAEFGDWLCQTEHIARIDMRLHAYRDGVYQAGDRAIEEAMVSHIRTLTAQKRTEVLRYLELTAPVLERSDARFIAFKNGVYDAVTGTLIPQTPNLVLTNLIPHDYAETEPGEVDEVLDRLSCGDSEIRDLLEEMAGYCMYRRNELRKAFVLLGDKANGKSTYLDMIKTMLGDSNVSSMDIKEIGDRFKTAELYGKLANIGDDVSDDFIKDPAIFKKAVSGDRMNAERKGRDPFDFAPYAKLLFSANAMPRMRDRSGAVLDRLIIVPFRATFARGGSDYDPYIKYRLREPKNVQRFIWLALRGLSRVLSRESFTVPESSVKEMEDFEHRNDSVKAFLDDGVHIEGMTAREIYRQYSEFCLADGIQPVSNIELSKQIKRRLGLSLIQHRINGERVRIYSK